MDFEMSVECFTGLDNPCPHAIVLYATNFSPTDCLRFYNIKFHGSCDPCPVETMLVFPLIDNNLFKNEMVENLNNSVLSRAILDFYLWFKGNYKINHNDNSVPQQISLICLILTSIVNWFKHFLGIIRLLSIEVPPVHVHINIVLAILPCNDMLGGEEFDDRNVISSKHASSLSSVEWFDHINKESSNNGEPLTRRHAAEMKLQDMDIPKLEDMDIPILLDIDITDLSPKLNGETMAKHSEKKNKLKDHKDGRVLLYGDIIDLTLADNDGICPATTPQNFVTVTSDSIPGALQRLNHQVNMRKTWKFSHNNSYDNVALVEQLTFVQKQNIHQTICVAWIKDNEIPGILDFRFASFLAAILKLDLWATDTGNPSDIVDLTMPTSNYVMSLDKPFKGIVYVAIIDGEHLAFEINVAGYLNYISNIVLKGENWKFRRKIGLHVCSSLYPWLHHTIFGSISIGFRLVSFLAALLKLDIWATDLGNPSRQ
jgi:hypothetical protein